MSNSGYYASRNIQAVERVLLGDVFDESSRFAAGETIVFGSGSVRLLAREFTYVEDTVRLSIVRGLGKGVARSLTAGASGIFSFGIQVYNDYDNPYLTGGEKFRRAGVSGLIGFGAAYIGGLIAGPPGFVIGLGLGIAGDLWAAPLVFKYITEDVPKRNLAPFRRND